MELNKLVVYLCISGYIRSHFKEDKYELMLKENATIKNLFEEVDKLMGKDLSKAIWNHDKKCFRGPVVVRVDGNIVKQESYNLKNGQVVEISRLLVGG